MMSKTYRSLEQWASDVETTDCGVGVVLNPDSYDDSDLKTCPGCDEYVRADAFNDHLADCEKVSLYLADDDQDGKQCPYCKREASILPEHLCVCPEADRGGI